MKIYVFMSYLRYVFHINFMKNLYFFQRHQDNIDRAVLRREQRRVMDQVESGDVSGETLVKSIKTIVG